MEEHLAIPDIPTGFFECRAAFTEPIFSAWFDDQSELLRQIYHALSPWGVDLEKISWNSAAKNLKEAKVTISVQRPPVVVSLGVGGLTVSLTNADWSNASTLVDLLVSLLGAVPAKLESQTAIIGFHLKPSGSRSFREVMKEFVNTEGLGDNRNTTMYGMGIYGSDYSLILDNSTVIAGGMFVKITRVFPADTAVNEIAAILWKDEQTVLNRLGFRMEEV